MNGFILKIASAWQLVFKRSLSSWRLLSSVILGVLLASSIMAGTVVYFDALREVALRMTLAKLTSRQIDILMQGEKGPTDKQEQARIGDLVDAVVADRVEWLVKERHTAVKSPTFFLADIGKEMGAGDDDARGYFAHLPLLDSQISITDGRKPRSNPINNPGETLEIEAMIPVEAAQLFGMGVADRIAAIPHWDDMTPSVIVVISGLFERNEPGGEYWYLEDAVLNGATGPTFRTMPFHVSESMYFDVLGSAFVRMDTTYAWLLSIDDDRIDAWNAAETLFDINALNSVLVSTLPTYRQETALHTTLSNYD